MIQSSEYFVITGETGVKGDTGLQGFTGTVGAIGTTGVQGIQGTVGTTGVAGVTGVQGIQGTIATDFTLGSIGGGGSTVTVKSGFVRLGDGRELYIPSDLEVSLVGSAEVTQVAFSVNARQFDYVSAGYYVMLYDGLNSAHYFWFKTSGGFNTQTDPAPGGTGHEVDIVAGRPPSGTIQVVDYTMLSGATITFYINPYPGSIVISPLTLTEGIDWTASTDNNTTANSIALAINNNQYLNGERDAHQYVKVPILPSGDTVTVYGEVVDFTTVASSDATNLPTTAPGADLTPADSTSTIANAFATSVATVSSSFNASQSASVVLVTNTIGGTATAVYATAIGVSTVVKVTGSPYVDGDWYAYVRLSELISSPTLVNGRRVYPVIANDIYLDTVAPEFQAPNDPTLFQLYGPPAEHRFPIGTIQRIGGIWSNPQSLATKEWAEELSYNRLHPLGRSGYNGGPENLYGHQQDDIVYSVDGVQAAWKIQASRSTTITGLRLWFNGGSGATSITVSLCADDVGGCQPGTVLATDSSSYVYYADYVVHPQNFANITGVGITAGDYYWIIIDTGSQGQIQVSVIDLPPIGFAVNPYIAGGISGYGSDWSYYEGGTANLPFGGMLYLQSGYAQGFDLYNNVYKVVTTGSYGQIPSSLIPIQYPLINAAGGGLSVGAGMLNGYHIQLGNEDWLKGTHSGYTPTVIDILKVNSSDKIEFGLLPYGPSGTDPSDNYQFATKHYVDNRIGTTGVAGATGVQGIQGTIGTTGVAGATGVKGTTGVAGATGVQGIQGTIGTTGVAGATGVQGIQGTIGTTGVAGATGVKGTTGVAGFTGLGSQGATGVFGQTGLQGSTGLSGSGGGSWSFKNSNYAAVASDKIGADTSGGTFTITFPASALAGDTITIADISGTFASYNLIIAPNGLNIAGASENFVLDVSNVNVTFTYYNTNSRGWCPLF